MKTVSNRQCCVKIWVCSLTALLTKQNDKENLNNIFAFSSFSSIVYVTAKKQKSDAFQQQFHYEFSHKGQTWHKIEKSKTCLVYQDKTIETLRIITYYARLGQLHVLGMADTCRL